MDICIDFDGTCVAHEFPKVGREIGAVPVLRELVEKGHNLILFTMRSNAGIEEGQTTKKDYLIQAVEWFQSYNIPLHGIQANPTHAKWTSSPKAYGQMYIDDAALGCPLIYSPGERPFVDWAEVRNMLCIRGLI